MLCYNNIFQNNIKRILEEGRYRSFLEFTRFGRNCPFASYKNRKVVMWCINDYLGMSQRQEIIDVATLTIKNNGIGSGGTRNIGGTHAGIIALEKEIAELHNKESSLLFTSGYVANDTTLSTFAKIIPNLVFFSDEFNHASIISGICNSKAQKLIYNHLNIKHLEELLKSVDILRPKIIVFESVYSMDGLFSPIEDILHLAKEYNAMTFIDEVHSVGLYGREGAGLANLMGCSERIDIIQGTLGKTYGAIGGYISGNSNVVDAIRLNAPGFIFTTSLPPVITDVAAANIKYLRSSDKERQFYASIVKKVKDSFDFMDIPYLQNSSHIIPIIIGDSLKAEKISSLLLEEYNIYVQHINFPTVPRGTERLRIIPNPKHTEKMILDLTKALFEIFQELGIPLGPSYIQNKH